MAENGVDPANRPAQYASRIEESCSLYSCNHHISSGGWYCCAAHERLAHQPQNMAFVIVDGYFGINTEKNREKDLRNVISLLKNVNYGIAQGIPLVEKGEIFQKVPWEWDFIDVDFLEGESDRSWVFFHKISNPTYKCFDYNDAVLKWTSNNYYSHEYVGRDGIASTISSTMAYLREHVPKGVDVSPMVDFWVRGWSLTEYTYKNQSLFCLTSSSEPKHIFNTKREQKGVKRKRNDGKGKGKRNDAESSSKGKGKNTDAQSVKKASKGTEEGKGVMADSESVNKTSKGTEDKLKGKGHLIAAKDIEAQKWTPNMVFHKLTDLEFFCRSTHMDADVYTSRQAVLELCSIGDLDDDVISALCAKLDALLEEAKVEALTRKTIMEEFENFTLAKEEAQWFSKYQKEGGGDHQNLERAEKAKTLISSIPTMIDLLSTKVNAWEKEKGYRFLYDKSPVLELLEEEKKKMAPY